MKKIYRQVVDHLRADFDPLVYGGTALMLAALCVANYGFDLFNSREVRPYRLLILAGLHAGPWLFVWGLQRLRGQVDAADGRFWRRVAFAVAAVTLVRWFPYHRELLSAFPPETHRWANAVLTNVVKAALRFAPIYVFWRWVDGRDPPAVYGLTLKGFDARPYILLLCLFAPVVFWASLQPAFLDAYPTYRPGGAEALIPVWVTVSVYELFYGFDFTFVELFFRGFLVIGFAKVLGPRAVLPMCAMYCVIHFGKPLPETIGSFFGGYILGVLALKSRSIAGGVLVHLGIAWLMELAAWLQLLSE